MKISVKQKHINLAAKLRKKPENLRSHTCPIALALNDATKKEWSVGYMNANIKRGVVTVTLPDKARNFIMKVDANEKVKPFTFEVEKTW